MSQEIGPFTVGEIPATLTYAFKDGNGTAIDLSGFDAVFQWGAKEPGGSFANIQDETTDFQDQAAGVARYEWTGAEFTTPGDYGAMFWVGDGTNRYASDLIEWSVCAAVGPAPSI